MVGHFAHVCRVMVTAAHMCCNTPNIQSMQQILPNIAHAMCVLKTRRGTSEMKNILQMFRDIGMAQA